MRALAILLFFVGCTSIASPQDFRSSRWGDTVARVSNFEGDQLTQVSPVRFAMDVDLGVMAGTAFFDFYRGQLYQGVYSLVWQRPPRTATVSENRYTVDQLEPELVVEILVSLYGDPIIEPGVATWNTERSVITAQSAIIGITDDSGDSPETDEFLEALREINSLIATMVIVFRNRSAEELTPAQQKDNLIDAIRPAF